MIRFDQKDLELIQTLGNGSFGEVFLVKSTVFGNLAIKSYPYANKICWSCVIKHLSKSKHLIQYFGSVNFNGIEYIVMEYAQKSSLDKLLIKIMQSPNEKQFQWDLRYQIALDIANGICDLHSNWISHHGIKSSNVLLDQRMNAKVSNHCLFTSKGDLANEISNNQSIPRAFQNDIFFLGMILLEIATCQLYDTSSNNIEEICSTIRFDEIVFPSQCSESFVELIKSCVDLDPNSRPIANSVVHELSKIRTNYWNTKISRVISFENALYGDPPI